MQAATAAHVGLGVAPVVNPAATEEQRQRRIEELQVGTLLGTGESLLSTGGSLLGTDGSLYGWITTGYR